MEQLDAKKVLSAVKKFAKIYGTGKVDIEKYSKVIGTRASVPLKKTTSDEEKYFLSDKEWTDMMKYIKKAGRDKLPVSVSDNEYGRVLFWVVYGIDEVKEDHDPFKPTYGTGDVIHDCPKHVEEIKTRTKGKVVGHTLNETGEVNYVDVDFGTGKIYENIPTKKLKVLEGHSHKHEVKEEPKVNELRSTIRSMIKDIIKKTR